MKKHLFICFYLFLLGQSIYPKQTEAVKASDKWQKSQWNAFWISPSQASKYDYGVHYFRKTVNLSSIGDSFIINVSGDQRYELYVNGVRVSRGPARGSLNNWYYETINIAPYLVKGKNTLASVVWNYGEWSPAAQISLYSAFIIQGETEKEEIFNTDRSWKTYTETSYSPSLKYLQDVGPGDIIDGNKYQWGWENSNFDDSEWLSAEQKENGQPQYTGSQYLRALMPRTIPLMEEKEESPLLIRRISGLKSLNKTLDSPMIIPPNSNVKILVDQGYLTNAYPSLSVSKGEKSKISLTYAESLFIDDNNKGNRNEIEHKFIKGFVDTYLLDGGYNRVYRPLWFRCYRYIELDVQTSDEELIINNLKGEFRGYPFIEKASFASNDKSIDDIWDIGWRTARLCAGETYYDCPYYEQLQYAGDTRIQCLISLYVGGDDRLMKKAINDLAMSIRPEGILQSRYPTRYVQVIPPFSLYWINTLHDYWMHRNDDEFVKSYLPVIKSILSWYASKVDTETQMLGATPHWNFVDWPNEWPWSPKEPTGGMPPGGNKGGSSVISLQLAYALGEAIELLDYFEEDDLVDKYTTLKNNICDAVYKRCFNQERLLMADDEKQTSYSQHASIMGILSGAIPAEVATETFKNMLKDEPLIQATVYYRFYLFLAMKKVGLAEMYTSSLDIWHNMIKNGLTTFAERPEPSRSDCHAWSASPNYFLLSTVCGVTPLSNGFKSVKIAPHLGHLDFIQGVMPHPSGDIRVNLKKDKNKLKGDIELPTGIHGEFIWEGEKISLKAGKNKIE